MLIGLKVAGREIRGSCVEMNKKISCEGEFARSWDILLLKCDSCGREFMRKQCNHFNAKKNRSNSKDLCRNCKIKETSLLKYGFESPNQVGAVKQKQHESSKEYRDGNFVPARKTTTDEELRQLKLLNLTKAHQTIKQTWDDWRAQVKKGALLARKDPSKYIISEEGQRNNRLASSRASKLRWTDPVYKEKMSKLRFRVSKFQLKLFEEKVKQDSDWKLEWPVPNSGYTADLCNPNTKEIIECFGDYWHCNPKKFAADYYHKIVHKTAQQIWDYDKQRLETLRGLGYSVTVVWESERK